MKLTLRYFASLREALGAGGALDWPVDRPVDAAAGVHGSGVVRDDVAADRTDPHAAAAAARATTGALRAWLRSQSEAHARALAPGRAVRVAVDQTLADDATPLHEGAEVAFFPPVTGG